MVLLLIGILWLVSSRHSTNKSEAVKTPATPPSTASPSTTSPPTTSPSSVSVPPSAVSVHIVGDHLVNASGEHIRLLGVDASGTQESCIRDQGFSPGSLNSTEAEAIASWHINAVRVPLNEDCWLGINGAPASYSGANYQSAIRAWVTALNNAGMIAILDLHWGAPGTYPATGEWPMADEDHSVTFWAEVAKAYASTPGVIFDLYNEPYLGHTHPTTADWSCWLNGCTNTTTLSATSPHARALVPYQTAGMQQLVNTVRAAGAKQPIMIGGLNFAGDPCGLSDKGGNGGVCEQLAYLPKDPLDQLAISFHTYLPNSSCTTESCWNAFTQAADAANIPIITGEFGEKDCSDAYMDSYMTWADQNDVSYLAWTWNVNQSRACRVGNDRANHYLLRSYDGTPTAVSPNGANYKAHLATLSADAPSS